MLPSLMDWLQIIFNWLKDILNWLQNILKWIFAMKMLNQLSFLQVKFASSPACVASEKKTVLNNGDLVGYDKKDVKQNQCDLETTASTVASIYQVLSKNSSGKNEQKSHEIKEKLSE